MALVSGRVLYDPERYLLHTSTGIPKVPVVLYCPAEGVGAVALTDENGLFRFTDIPPGRYQLTEDYCPNRSGPAVVNYIQSVREMHQPQGGDPPLSHLKGIAVPKEVDTLDSLTPNTVFLDLLEGNHPTIFFFDGPVGHKATFSVKTVGRNLITAAGRGTFGTIGVGSKTNTFDTVEAYPNTVPGFVHSTGTQLPPGHYTLVGTLHPGFGRHILSDSTSGQETGRMLLLNGNTPQERTAFHQEVSLQAGEYLLAAWALSENRFSFLTPAKVALSVTAEDGRSLLEVRLLLESRFLPIWQQVGGRFTCSGPTRATVRIYVWGEESFGNDILLDDISLRAAASEEGSPCLRLSASRPMAPIGGALHYTACIENPGEAPALSVFYRDPLADGLSFVRDTLSIDCGAPLLGGDPTVGVPLGELPAHSTKTLRYQVVLEKVPSENPIETAGELTWQSLGGIMGRAGSSPVSLWASDRCFCEELMDGPLADLLRRSKLPEVLGIPECQLCKTLKEMGCPDCAPVDVILRLLGALGEKEKQ